MNFVLGIDDWSADGNFLVVDDKVNETDPLSLYLVPVSVGRRLRFTYVESGNIDLQH